MEVILAGLSLAASALCLYLYLKSKSLREETESLGEALQITLKDSEQALEDQKASERQLAITTAKLEGLEQSTLTPDNSIPKDIHVNKVTQLADELAVNKLMIKDLTEKYETLRGKQISERVRLGAVGENFCAFHNEFPYDRKKVKALFQPVDLIYFGEDEVVFIDVKTGGSQLSKKQRTIRDNIKAGKVRFEIHRLDENGYDIKEC